MDREAWIIDAVRSPRGKGKETGALHPVHPQRLLAQVLTALQERNGLDTADVDDVVMGCGAGSGDHAMDIARMAALDAGWSLDAPGVTLNRFCGSGQQAVNFAAMGILSGFQDVVVGGGVESMSRPAPLHVDGFTANNHHLRDRYNMVAQGISADLIATRRGVQPRRVRPAGRRQPGPGPGRHRRGPVRQVARPDPAGRRQPGPRPRGVPPPGHDRRRPREAASELRQDGRRPHEGPGAHRRPDGAAGLPPTRRDPPRPPRRQLLGRRRRRVRRAGDLARVRHARTA